MPGVSLRRRQPAYSGRIRLPVPTESDHLFRGFPITPSCGVEKFTSSDVVYEWGCAEPRDRENHITGRELQGFWGGLVYGGGAGCGTCPVNVFSNAVILVPDKGE